MEFLSKLGLAIGAVINFASSYHDIALIKSSVAPTLVYLKDVFLHMYCDIYLKKLERCHIKIIALWYEINSILLEIFRVFRYPAEL